jgi:hypothetical protein
MNFLRTDASAAPWFKAPMVMTPEPALQDSYEMPQSNDVSIFPNPSDGAATISFTLERESQVDITLYDMQGRIVRTLTNSELPSGENKLSVLTNTIARGLYQIRISGDAINEVRHIVVK